MATDSGKSWLLMLTLGLTTGIDFFENSMVVLSAAHIQSGVGATPEEFVWVTAAYAISGILMILLQREMAEGMGYRRYLTLTLLIYAAGSVGCGLAHSPWTLIAARFFQGLGAGALFTSCRILLQHHFIGPERTVAVRFFIGGIFGASTLAPLMASIMVDRYAWNAVFFLVVPVILGCAVLCWISVSEWERRAERRRHYDYWPVALFAVALVTVEILMQQVRFEFLLASPHLLVLLAAGIIAFAVFFLHQYHAPSPILHLHSLRNCQFLTGLVFYFLYYLLSNSFSYLFPIFCERGLGYSVPQVGMLLFSSALVSLLTVTLYLAVGRHLTRKKGLMCAGLALFGLANWGMSRLSPDAGVGSLVWPLVLRGMFGGMLVLPVAGLAFLEFDQEYYGHAYRLKNIVRQLCGTFAVAVMTVTLQHRSALHQAVLGVDMGRNASVLPARLQRLTDLLIHRGYGPVDAHAAALAIVARSVERQILILSCQDAFRILAFLSLVGLGLMLWQNRLR